MSNRPGRWTGAEGSVELMSANPYVMLGGPITVIWGNRGQGGYAVTYIDQQLLGIAPGSALEAAIGTANFLNRTLGRVAGR